MNGIGVLAKRFLDSKFDLGCMASLGLRRVSISDAQVPVSAKFGQGANIAHADKNAILRLVPGLDGRRKLRKFSTLRTQEGAGVGIEVEVIKRVPDLGKIITRCHIDNHCEEDDISRYRSGQIDALCGGEELKSSPKTAGSLSQHVMSSLRGTENHETVINESKRVALTGGGIATIYGVQNMTQVAASKAQYVRILFERQMCSKRYGGRVAKWAEDFL
jgi:hypothetical protein